MQENEEEPAVKVLAGVTIAVLTLPHTLQLARPIVTKNVAGEVISTKTEIVFQNELNADMMGHMPSLPEYQLLKHYYGPISKMTGETLDTIKKLSVMDVNKCTEILTSFL